MVCELRAVADRDGYLCLHLRSPNAAQDWLSCELRGETVAMISASGRQLVSAQAALKLLLRELFLRELADGEALLPDAGLTAEPASVQRSGH